MAGKISLCHTASAEATALRQVGGVGRSRTRRQFLERVVRSTIGLLGPGGDGVPSRGQLPSILLGPGGGSQML